MKLLVLSESANHVSCRYRVRAFEPALRRAGWHVVERPLSCPSRSFISILHDAARSDVVLIQRRLLSAAKVALLRRCARRLIYDVDDAVFWRDSNSRKSPECRRRRNRFQAIVSAADAVIAGNDFLAEQAARWSRHGRIVRIPTCVNPDDYPPNDLPDRANGLRLAWIGSGSTLPSLNEIGPALRSASRRVPGLELHVICDRAIELPGVKTILHHWSPETEALDLTRCDVGISWLPDHPWSRGKCGLKVLQYMAASLPVIVNPVGVHQQLVSPGVHGLVLSQATDVCEALGWLAQAPTLRRRMGLASRRRAKVEFSVQAWSRAFLELIQSVTQRGSLRAAA